MNIKKNFALTAVLCASFAFTACNDFLDVMPDNRTELDTEDKIVSMMVSGYSQNLYCMTAEMSSDNIDLLPILNGDNELWIEQLFNREDVPDSFWDYPADVWSGAYGAIASCNQVLEAIEDLGGATTDKLKAAQGEALVSRAYHHFILVNMFCQAYNPKTAKGDMGVPYMFKPETTLNPKYERGTVADVYAAIAEDVEAGVPLISNSIYSIPKYHFNEKAANAFAARFYLFYQDYDKAVAYANVVLGSTPASLMRDNVANGSLGLQSADGSVLLRTMDYIDATHNANLLLATGLSQAGVFFGPYGAYTMYNHGNWINETETYNARTSPYSGTPNSDVYSMNKGNADKTFAWKMPYIFEYSDPVAGIGQAHTVVPLFTIEETLLCRAEAYIMQKNYTAALKDMNLWASKFYSGATALSLSSAASWASRTAFYTPVSPTVKKKFEMPAMQMDESGDQANLMYVLAHLRRLETLHSGQRFFDIKRFGIKVTRRKLGVGECLGTIGTPMGPRDPRCAIQIPIDVINAGFTANPR